ncbi:MAG: hypothetical protein BJ554DRAFT_2627, partial [Olpidium bornovanus]
PAARWFGTPSSPTGATLLPPELPELQCRPVAPDIAEHPPATAGRTAHIRLVRHAASVRRTGNAQPNTAVAEVRQKAARHENYPGIRLPKEAPTLETWSALGNVDGCLGKIPVDLRQILSESRPNPVGGTPAMFAYQAAAGRPLTYVVQIIALRAPETFNVDRGRLSQHSLQCRSAVGAFRPDPDPSSAVALGSAIHSLDAPARENPLRQIPGTLAYDFVGCRFNCGGVTNCQLAMWASKKAQIFRASVGGQACLHAIGVAGRNHLGPETWRHWLR